MFQKNNHFYSYIRIRKNKNKFSILINLFLIRSILFLRNFHSSVSSEPRTKESWKTEG